MRAWSLLCVDPSQFSDNSEGESWRVDGHQLGRRFVVIVELNDLLHMPGLGEKKNCTRHTYGNKGCYNMEYIYFVYSQTKGFIILNVFTSKTFQTASTCKYYSFTAKINSRSIFFFVN